MLNLQSEWCAIDLHMHTIQGYTGDGNRDKVDNFTFINFIGSLLMCGIKLAAITNHNHIDLVNFVLCKYLGSKVGINLLLGVELDSFNKYINDYHLVCLFDETFLNAFDICKCISEKVKESRNENDNLIRFKTADILNLLRSYKTIMIPHGNKSKGLLKRPSEDEIKNALLLVKEGFIRVFDSPSDYKLEEIKEYAKKFEEKEYIDKFGGVLFSDNRNWLEYDTKFKKFYMHALPTFKGFNHAICNPVKRFNLEEFIKPKANFISEITIDSKKGSSLINSCTVKLSNGYNCIIGKSGSGKSLLLYLIQKMLVENCDCEKYQKYTDCDIVLKNENSMNIEKNTINLAIGEKIYDKVIEIVSRDETKSAGELIKYIYKDYCECSNFNEYKNEYRYQLLNYIKLNEFIIKQTDCVRVKFNNFKTNLKLFENLKQIETITIDNLPNKFLFYDENLLKEIKCICFYIKEIKERIAFFNNDIIENDLNDILSNFEDRYLTEMRNIYIENKKNVYSKKKIEIINVCLNAVNENISSNAKQKNTICTSFNEELENLVKEFVLVKKMIICKKVFDVSIKLENINTPKKSIPNHSNISYEESIDLNEIMNMQLKDNKLFKTYGNKQKLINRSFDMTDKVSSKEAIDIYIRENVISENNLDVFTNLKPKVILYFNGQDVTTMNPGDIAKTYIKAYFKQLIEEKNSTVLIYDQIENDIDKEFINNVLLKLLEEAEAKCQVLIVTHDPIIAVNGDPINYIISEKGVDGRISYRNFRPESDERDELETIAKCVDGSKKVIKERYLLYDGRKVDEN